MNADTAYNNTQKLIAEISSLLDDVEHELSLENYDEARTALTELIDKACLFSKLLQLIQNSSAHMYSCVENNDADTARMVGLEDTCRNLADHACKTWQELENHFNEHPALSNSKVVINPTYQVTFFTTDNRPLITHEANLEQDNNGKTYFLFKKQNLDSDPQSKYIFDQLNQSDPIALTVDDILSITTVGYEIKLSILKNRKVENQWAPFISLLL